MERKARTKKTSAKALTSPAPRRVSLCKAGANQTPLAKFKGVHITVQKKELPDMITSLKADGFAIVSFAFKGDQWTNDAVTAWLTDGGYTETNVEGAAGDFTVKGEDAPEDATTREITTDDGVVITLAKAAAEETPAVETAEPAAEDAGSAVQPVAKSEDEGFGGFIERCKAAGVPEARLKSLYTVSEFADLIRSLKWLVNDLSYDVLYDQAEAADGQNEAAELQGRNAVLTELKSIGTQLLAAFATLVNVEVGELGESFKSAKEDTAMKTNETPAAETPAVETPAVETPAVETPAAEVETPAVETPEAEVAVETPAADEKSEAPAWFTNAMSQITKSVETLTERVSVVEKSASSDEETGTETVVNVPARKSEDADEANTNSTTATPAEKSATDKVEDLRFKSALGF